MSYSVRFYIDGKKSSNGLGEITNSAQNFGKFIESSQGDNYYEFKTESHLMAHPDEFIPIKFQEKIRPLVTKVTMVTKNYGRYGINGGDTRVPVLIGSSIVSLEQSDVMIVGRSIKLIVKAYLLFCKYNGKMPDYQEIQAQQRETELRKKYNDALLKIKELEEKLKNVTEKKKGFFNFK